MPSLSLIISKGTKLGLYTSYSQNPHHPPGKTIKVAGRDPDLPSRSKYSHSPEEGARPTAPQPEMGQDRHRRPLRSGNLDCILKGSREFPGLSAGLQVYLSAEARWTRTTSSSPALHPHMVPPAPVRAASKLVAGTARSEQLGSHQFL